MTVQAQTYTLEVGANGDSVSGQFCDATDVRESFCFELAGANKAAKDLRAAAASWAEAFQKEDKTERQCWEMLHDEAMRCFRFVFGDVSDRIEELLKQAPAHTELWVKQSDSQLEMPWGLLCTESDAQQAAAEPRQPLLWSAKYNLRTSLRQGQGRASNRRNESWGFESVVCSETFNFDIKMLAPEAVCLARNIKMRSLDPRHPQRAKDAPPNCFVYVHAHSESCGDLLFKPSGDMMEFKRSPIEIVNSIVHPASGGVALAVLNACGSVLGFQNMGPSLVMQSANIEVACIATEIPAERSFAIKFGLELIDRCVQQGESTYAAMRAMRRKHYPLSIIYSHYSLANLTSNKPLTVFDAAEVEEYRKSIEHANYSYPQCIENIL